MRTPENAVKLRRRTDSLREPPLDPAFGPEPKQCPSTVILGSVASAKLYANPRYRPALDAWDQGRVTPADLRRWSLELC